jgi:hypothetical protein
MGPVWKRHLFTSNQNFRVVAASASTRQVLEPSPKDEEDLKYVHPNILIHEERNDRIRAVPSHIFFAKSIGLNCVTDFSTMHAGHAVSDRQSGNQWPS